MKFEIDVDIPDGYEPTGEYRKPREGEWFLGLDDLARQSRMDWVEARLILREKPLAYEDFEPRHRVSVTEYGMISVGSAVWAPAHISSFWGALIAAAEHVDRVNQQNNAA